MASTPPTKTCQEEYQVQRMMHHELLWVQYLDQQYHHPRILQRDRHRRSQAENTICHSFSERSELRDPQAFHHHRGALQKESRTFFGVNWSCGEIWGHSSRRSTNSQSREQMSIAVDNFSGKLSFRYTMVSKLSVPERDCTGNHEVAAQIHTTRCRSGIDLDG